MIFIAKKRVFARRAYLAIQQTVAPFGTAPEPSADRRAGARRKAGLFAQELDMARKRISLPLQISDDLGVGIFLDFALLSGLLFQI